MEAVRGQSDRLTRRALSRKQKRRRRSVSVVMLAVLLAASCVLIVNLFFKVSEIRVENSVTSVYRGEQIVTASGIKKGQNMFSLKKNEITVNLLDTLPYIGRVDIERRFPNTVVLRVSETTDYVGIPYRGGYLIVSSEMKILNDTFLAPVEMPIVYGILPTSFIPGSVLTAENQASIEGLEAVFEQLAHHGWFDKVTAINVRDKLDVSMVYDSRVFVRIGSISKIDYKFELLSETLSSKLEDDFAGTMNLSTAKYAYVTAGGMRFPAGFFDIE